MSSRQVWFVLGIGVLCWIILIFITLPTGCVKEAVKIDKVPVVEVEGQSESNQNAENRQNAVIAYSKVDQSGGDPWVPYLMFAGGLLEKVFLGGLGYLVFRFVRLRVKGRKSQ